MLQCVAVWCSVLQCVAVCGIVWQCVEVGCSVRDSCVAVCCSVLQCVAVCCVAWQCVEVWCSVLHIDLLVLAVNSFIHCHTLHHTATHCNTYSTAHCNTGALVLDPQLLHTRQHIHCNALQHIHCNTLQHIATHCNTLQHTATQVHWFSILNSFIHCNTLQHTATRCNTGALVLDPQLLHDRAVPVGSHRHDYDPHSSPRFPGVGVAECVAVCCSVLQCVAASCRVCCSVCCSVLQRAAECCRVLRCVASPAPRANDDGGKP